MKFILQLVIPAVLAFLAFSFCNGAFSDAHGLHKVFVYTGWGLSALVAGQLVYYFGKFNKKK